MARLEASFNDREQQLWYKAAWNLYEWGTENGVAGLTVPRPNEPTFDLLKKMVYYTAAIASSN